MLRLENKVAVVTGGASGIGQAIVDYIMVLSPQRIILGGGVTHQECLLPLVRKEVEEAAPTSKTAAMSEDDTELFDLLKKLRARLAAKASMAPYMVFSNATLQEIARKKPRNRTDFRKISGVGEIKTAWYAQDFLEVINQYLSEG